MLTVMRYADTFSLYWLARTTVALLFCLLFAAPYADAEEPKKRYCTVQAISNGYQLAPASCTLISHKADIEAESFLKTDCPSNGFLEEKFTNQTVSSPDYGTYTKSLKFIGSEIHGRSGFAPTKQGLDAIGNTIRFDIAFLKFSGDWFGPLGSGSFKGSCM